MRAELDGLARHVDEALAAGKRSATSDRLVSDAKLVAADARAAVRAYQADLTMLDAQFNLDGGGGDDFALVTANVHVMHARKHLGGVK